MPKFRCKQLVFVPFFPISPFSLAGLAEGEDSSPDPFSLSSVFTCESASHKVNKGKWKDRNAIPLLLGIAAKENRKQHVFIASYTFIPVTWAHNPRRKMQFGSDLIAILLKPRSKNGKNPNNARGREVVVCTRAKQKAISIVNDWL